MITNLRKALWPNRQFIEFLKHSTWKYFIDYMKIT